MKKKNQKQKKSVKNLKSTKLKPKKTQLSAKSKLKIKIPEKTAKAVKKKSLQKVKKPNRITQKSVKKTDKLINLKQNISKSAFNIALKPKIFTPKITAAIAVEVEKLISQPVESTLLLPSASDTLVKSVDEKIEHLEKPVRNSEVASLDFYDTESNHSLKYLQELKDVRILPQKHKINLLAKVDFFSLIKEKIILAQPQEQINELDEIEDIFSKPAKIKLFQLNIPRNWYIKIAAFVLMTILVVAPLQAFSYYQGLVSTKDRILFMTNEAIDNLKQGESAAKNLDLNGASNQFGLAKDKFGLAREEVNKLDSLTTEILKILPNESRTIESGVALLEAGQLISESGEVLAGSVGNIMENQNYDNYYQALLSFRIDLGIVIQKYYQAKEKLKSVSPKSIPAEHREKLTQLIKYLPVVESGLIELYDITDSVLYALGDKQWQRYLLIFVNNNELRASGGFQGSFALVDIDRGKIKKIAIPAGGTYDIQGQLVPRVISPEPLHLINSRWEFQDSNWWPDYPTAAKKIQWFYTNANNPSVDGVITISSNMMEKLLEIFGPVDMPEYNRVITAENFETETQKIVELEYDRKLNRPKQFLADLAPKLLERLFLADKEQAKKLFETAIQSLNERQLMPFFNRESLQNLVTEFGWSGELRQTEGDFLSVIHSNIAGGKTDEVIVDTIRHQAEIQADGSIIDTVTVVRKHNGVPGSSPFYGVQNNNYIRFYVPLGSTLIEAKGFETPPSKFFDDVSADLQKDIDLLSVETQRQKDEKSGTDIYNENGKTVFGHWFLLPAGAIGQVTIKYRLPFTLSLNNENTYFYSLLTQKQAGTKDTKLTSNLIVNENFKIIAKFPSDLPGEEKQISFNSVLNTDQYYGVALVNK